MEQPAAPGAPARSAEANGIPVNLSRRALGQFGENLAAKHLEAQGYRIVARNWRQGRHGEIDLVALDGQCLVFVEVKTRSTDAFGPPAEAVGRAKLARLRRLVGLYLQQDHPPAKAVRLDVIAITTGGSGRRLEHFKGVGQ